jgi:hypothetical protein
MNINERYTSFLESSLIRDNETLVKVLKGFPYYCEIVDFGNILLIKRTKKSIEYASLFLLRDQDILNVINPFTDYMEILDNMIINKLNYLDFYYFGKNKQEIVSKELLKKLNIDINLKKHIFYKHNDHIKYYLCYMNNKWCVSSQGKLDIYSLNNKSLFEKYTLYELLLQSFKCKKITFENFDKKYNYVLTLNSIQTYLTIYENSNIDMEIYSIIEKKTNKIIKLNRKTLDRLKLRINIPIRLYFNDLFHFKKDIMLSHNQRMIVKNIETKEEQICSYPKFTETHLLLENFNKDPVKNVYDMIKNRQLGIFMNSFPLYNYFINNLIKITNMKIEHLFKKYVNVYIKKNTDSVFLPYEKELLLRIHTIYQRYHRRITKIDVGYMLYELKTEKINKILLINYNLKPNIFIPCSSIPIIDYSQCD